MQNATWLRRASWLGAIGVALTSGSLILADDAAPDEKPAPAKDAAAAKDPTPPKDPATPKVPATAKEAKEPKAVKKATRYQIKVGGPKFRLGLHLSPVSPALNEQLDLKGEGLVVEHVLPEGPADKAGVKRNDILLAVGDTPIKSIPGLLEAENASDGKEVSLKLLRGGKPITVNVTPTKHEGDVFVPHKSWAVDTEEIEHLIKDKLKQAGADVRMEFLKPGKIFPPGVFAGRRHEFPDDLSVNIHKEGKSPAAIDVKRGDKTWSVKEDDLDELPDDVRPHVEALLGQGAFPLTVRFGDGRRPPHPPGVPHPDDPDGQPHGGPRAEGPGGPDGPAPADGPPRGGPEGRRRRGPGGPPDGPGALGPPDGPGGPPPPREGRSEGPGGTRQTRERARGSLEHRLEELSGRMQEMRRHMDELRDIIRREAREDREPQDDE